MEMTRLKFIQYYISLKLKTKKATSPLKKKVQTQAKIRLLMSLIKIN